MVERNMVTGRNEWVGGFTAGESGGERVLGNGNRPRAEGNLGREKREGSGEEDLEGQRMMDGWDGDES